ncbi:alpha-D-kanosaminyltransferase [Lachnospiraceae bacterium]|nr:alpha-D-kanosaminyltransferase [Lachnospiraceae bacterium]
MKKILILLKHLSLGGAEKMFLRILNSVDISIYNIHVMLVFDEKLQALPNLPNLKVTAIFHEKNDVVKHLIRNHPEKIYSENIIDKYDVEIAFLEGYPTQIIGASSNPHSLKVAFIHTDFRFFHHSLNAYINADSEIECYRKYKYIIYVSETARKGFHITYPFVLHQKEHIFYPPLTENMLVPSYFTPTISDERPYFITLTRLAPEKGVFKLIHACKKVIELGYEVCFRIYGSGPLYNQLLQMIYAQDLERYIYLMGYHQAPYTELRNSLAYVCPSDHESFCIAIEEALFSSVPVIACRCSGTEEILHNGDFGLLVENHSDGLAAGISQFLSNSDLSALLRCQSQNGKIYWQNMFKSANSFSELFYHTRASK